MVPAAQTKANEIIEVLSALPTRSKSNLFKLRQQKKDAEALLINNPEQGYTLLGAIACMTHDMPAMENYHTSAINYSGRSFYALTNYAISLTMSFLWNKSLVVYEEVYRENPSDLVAISNVIEACFRVGYTGKALEYLHKWNKLSPNEKFTMADDVSILNRAIANFSITEIDLHQAITVASEYLHETDQLIKRFRFTSVQVGASSFLNYEIVFKDCGVDICEIETQFDEIINCKIKTNIMNHLVFTFSCDYEETNFTSLEMPASNNGVSGFDSIDFENIAKIISGVEPL